MNVKIFNCCVVNAMRSVRDRRNMDLWMSKVDLDLDIRFKGVCDMDIRCV